MEEFICTAGSHEAGYLYHVIREAGYHVCVCVSAVLTGCHTYVCVYNLNHNFSSRIPQLQLVGPDTWGDGNVASHGPQTGTCFTLA